MDVAPLEDFVGHFILTSSPVRVTLFRHTASNASRAQEDGGAPSATSARACAAFAFFDLLADDAVATFARAKWPLTFNEPKMLTDLSAVGTASAEAPTDGFCWGRPLWRGR